MLNVVLFYRLKPFHNGEGWGGRRKEGSSRTSPLQYQNLLSQLLRDGKYLNIHPDQSVAEGRYRSPIAQQSVMCLAVLPGHLSSIGKAFFHFSE